MTNSRVHDFARAYPEVLAVLVAALLGLTVSAPLRWLVDHQGINVLLIVLVFTTGVTITVGDMAGVVAHRRRLATALVAGVTILPALAWLAARIVTAGPLRNGTLTIGLAPCEIASVATVTMAGGQAALAAAMLIGSTALAVIVSGPLLTLEAGHASLRPMQLVVNLAIVVLVPLAAGIAARAYRNVGVDRDRLTSFVSTMTVAALVGLIASEVRLSTTYLAVFAATILFLAASASVGGLLCIRATDTLRVPLLLTVSMRDFAIAAGMASAAFGANAAAPLGAYGIIVLVWGSAAAGRLRRIRAR